MTHGLYPDDLAAAIVKNGGVGTAYQPSNGTEGMAFYSAFCDHCIYETYNEATRDPGCPIIAAATRCTIGDPDYPVEWQYGPDGQPTCTKWCP